jgi:hypothetical protein
LTTNPLLAGPFLAIGLSGALRFDIRLQGRDQAVFFDV